MIRIFDGKERSQSAPALSVSEPDVSALESRQADLQAAAEADEHSAAAIESDIPGLGWQLAQLREKRDSAIQAGNTAVVERLGAQMSSISVKIEDATKRAAEFRKAAASKSKEAAQVAREIKAVQRAPLEQKRREKIDVLIPVLVEAARIMAGIHGDERELLELGSQLEPAAWNQLSFSGGEGIQVTTWLSRWLEARRAEGFDVPPSENNELHIPPSTDEWARIQIDSQYLGHAASCGTRSGIVAGFGRGFLHRARNFR